MNLLSLLAEAMFGIVFVAVGWQFLRKPDALRGRVLLVFLPLTVVFAATALRAVVTPPPIVGIVSVALLLAQPLFTIWLISAVERVPRAVMLGILLATALSVITLPFLTTVDQSIGIAGFVVDAAVFFIGQSIGAAYLLRGARRRRGAGAARLTLAAIATALIGIALIVVVLAGLAPAGVTAPRDGALFLALLAGLGYLFAFFPPPQVRRVWQADVMVDYSRSLVDRAAASVPEIWAGYARLAHGLGGVAAVVVQPTDDEEAITALSGLPADLVGASVPAADIVAARAATLSGDDLPTAAVGPGLAKLAAAAEAAFVSAVGIDLPGELASRGVRPATLLVFGRHRSLFGGPDHEILGPLGIETAVLAERRAITLELEELASRLATTVDAVRSASEAKSDFLASMSHELRTPLSAILGFSDLMRNEPRDGESVTVPVEWVEHIHRGADHLLSLINDVLDLAKVEAGRVELQLEPIDLGMAVAESVNGLRPLAERKRLQLVASTPALTLTADRGRFRQILYNLLSNAIKYTPDGGSVRVEAVTEGDDVRLAVQDTGIGIAPEDLGSVFDEFQQVGDPGERQPGTGLGLALTRRLAEAHGGRIEVMSTRGVGSTFTVILPRDGPGRAAPAGTPVASATEDRVPVAVSAQVDVTPGTGVLVIEDDPSAVRLLREYTQPSGFRVTAAATGAQGLIEARAVRPAAIFLDVLLPDMDGWEVLRQLKSDPELASIPVLILSVVDEREVGLALGAIDYLVKPVDRRQLLGVLDRVGIRPDPANRPIRVLAVDDDPAALEMIRATLQPDGYEVMTCQGGREAIEAFGRARPDVVVCDLLMPDVDGFEVVAAISGQGQTGDVPILVYTSHDLSAADKARLNGHISGIVVKGPGASTGLRTWLRRVASISSGSDTTGQVASPGPA